MKIEWIRYSLLMLLLVGRTQGQEEEFETLDTNYYVAGVADWKGNLTVQVYSPLEFAQLKKDVALDNSALNFAYQNIKSDWKAKPLPGVVAIITYGAPAVLDSFIITPALPHSSV